VREAFVETLAESLRGTVGLSARNSEATHGLAVMSDWRRRDRRGASSAASDRTASQHQSGRSFFAIESA
jgi:hypothetical protein